MRPVTLPDSRPAVQLTGRNPYAALAACMNAARQVGWLEAQIQVGRQLAASGSLDAVLQVCREWFEAS